MAFEYDKVIAAFGKPAKSEHHYYRNAAGKLRDVPPVLDYYAAWGCGCKAERAGFGGTYLFTETCPEFPHGYEP